MGSGARGCGKVHKRGVGGGSKLISTLSFSKEHYDISKDVCASVVSVL